jgi:hypothetical protein
MTVRVYLLPAVTVTDARGHVLRVPKYFAEPGQLPLAGLEDVPATSNDFGLQPTMLVVADVTPAQHTLLSTQGDVTAIPADITQNVSTTALATVKANLEALSLPAGWVTTTNTYSQVLHAVMAIFQFAGRFQALTGLSPFNGGATLDTRFNQLSQTVQDGIVNTAADMGLSTAGLTPTTTLRQILKSIADQFPPFTVGPLTFA